MIRIHLPSTGYYPLTYDVFENHQLPTPVNGVEAQDNNAILLFDNVIDAVTYAEHLEAMATHASNYTPGNAMLRDVVAAIRNNEHVKIYME